MPTQDRKSNSARAPQPNQAPVPEEEQPGEPTPPQGKVRPVHVERIANIRAAIWANDGGQSGVYYVVTASRIYKDGQNQWQSSDHFGRDDLLVLAKVLDRAHSWICDTLQAPATPF
jgi:hypothetical protein